MSRLRRSKMRTTSFLRPQHPLSNWRMAASPGLEASPQALSERGRADREFAAVGPLASQARASEFLVTVDPRQWPSPPPPTSEGERPLECACIAEHASTFI